MKQQEIIGVRYFEKEEYAKDFIEGKIFFNSAGTFQNIKNDEQFYNEGQVPIHIDEIKINNESIRGDIKYTLFYEEDKRVPICCFSYLTKNDFCDGIYLTDVRMKQIYKYFVIFNIGDLLKAVSKEICNKGCGICAKPVEYFDFSDKSNPWTKLDLSDIPAHYRKFFIHSNNHDYQKEFRIVITHRMFDYEGANTKIDVGKDWSSVKLKIGTL